MEAELERLRRQLREEQRLREEAEAEREEAKARAAAEERQREEAEAKAIAEQQRREEAEAINRRTTLTEFLEACHQLSRAIDVVTDPKLTTQGDTTKPTGRQYPRRIIPWEDFPDQQKKIWQQLSASQSLHSNPAFPSLHQMDYVRTNLKRISSEDGVRKFAQDTVENVVQTLLEEVYKDEGLRKKLGLHGTVTFESHTNIGPADEESVDEAMGRMSISEPLFSSGGGRRGNGGAKGRGEGKAQRRSREVSRPAGSRPARGAQRGVADQFCIYRLDDGSSMPAVAIEYKAPHKLTRGEIAAGLSGEIVPDRDVIRKDGEGFVFLSKRLLAAIVTQCFSYMVKKGLQDGYLYTGEAIVFLHIPDDPALVYYHVCIPNLDVQDDDEGRLHRTAVAQVFAFVLRALAAERPPSSWHDAARALKKWEVEYIDILKTIPETVRKASHDASTYKPRRWKAFPRSPILTRSRCSPDDGSRAKNGNDGSDGDDGDEGDMAGDVPPSPTPRQSTRSQSSAGASRRTKGTRGGTRNSSSKTKGKGKGRGGADARETESAPRPRIEDRPYCTHECLLGLLHGGPLDEHCPNVRSHRKKHIKPETFLRLVRQQLARDRGRDADCKPLYIHGSRGALFKVRLSSHGYTLVAKGMEEHNAGHLQHENRMYQHVSAVQGKAVPVCVGIVDLKLPCYSDCGVYTHMLFLSWAGRPLFKFIDQDNKAALLERAKATLGLLHGLGLLHNDAEMRNVLWDGRTGGLMWTDLERAEVRAEARAEGRAEGRARRPLGEICPNRKRKRTASRSVR
ncbi:hypothetical protein MPH_14005 [Macrophomina phaseolina MS6]|uniref:Protein kinase domain-containing protein n=1 Tax=Macrophomina phaseolina (strain MS6) TaxID=1126212 RepID=K2RG20_MACPH|nr:hypothetical protein MPH_14005 [Macrophomina phaseolina MS6]